MEVKESTYGNLLNKFMKSKSDTEIIIIELNINTIK